jgi:MFS family permease
MEMTRKLISRIFPRSAGASPNQPATVIPPSIYTRPFFLLCFSHALFAGSFNMIIPELPAYLDGMKGGAHKGLIIALFTLTAGLSRPFSGKLTDTIGRLPVMYIGTIACVVCSLSYPLLHFVAGFLFLRFMHGFSTGFKPTATAAYVADVVPSEKRGEAMGILGICLSLGASSSPLLGSYIASRFGTDMMFYTSSVLAFGSIMVLLRLPETLKEKQPFSFQLLKIGKDDIFDPDAIPAGIVMLFCYVSYGVLLTLVPDLSDNLHVPNRGIFFAIFTLSSASTRIFAGRISDRIGRVPVLKFSAWVIALSMFLLAYAHEAWMLYLGSVVFGLGNGIFSPAINAWTIDLSRPSQRGRALSTMFIALEIAIGGGALFSGWYFASQIDRMQLPFITAGVISIGAWVYLQFFWKKPAKHISSENR